MSGRDAGLLRGVGAGGLLWGALLLAWPGRLWLLVEGRAPDTVEHRATLALGVRHVLQGGAQLVLPRATGPAVVTVDVVHAVSMLALGTAASRSRRALGLSATVALASAAVTAGVRRRAG